MGKIKVMDENLSNLIAAGEVVERPLSIVKELVENSIDALSTKITIDMKASGIDYIKVIDNGVGMDSEDALLCFSPHSSSKLTSKEMLFKIATMGFRGEALSSLASVSRVKLQTCNGEDSSEIVIEGNKLLSQTKSSFRKGTSFEVTKLFYNTPARLKYLSNEYVELSKIIEYVMKVALANPNIVFTLINNDKTIISTTGSNDVVKTIFDLYSISISKEVEAISSSIEDVSLKVYLANAAFQRSNKNYVHIFVNGRVVYNSEVIKAVINAYSPYMPKNRYPFCIVNITIDPTLIDVNIHPSKYEIKFSKEDELLELLNKCISEYLQGTNHIVEIKKTPVKNEFVQDKLELERHSFNNEQVEKPAYASEEKVEYVAPATKLEKLVELAKPVEKKHFYVPIGQYAGTYILAQKEDMLILIDQHAAEERINYEKNQESVQFENISIKDLLVPLTLSYSQDEAIIINNRIDMLTSFGIGISSFGMNDFVIRSLPQWLDTVDEMNYINYIMEKVLENEELSVNDVIDDVIEMISCKESLKANTRLSIIEMERLIDKLFNCKNPYNCPHGRPTIISLTLNEIEKLFKRVN